MAINVPSQYQLYVNNAASQLGISPDIVAAQIQLESGFDPNAQSSAGAEGIAQFEPGTFQQYGNGSPYNASDAFGAYVNYMRTLLQQYNGNVREALAAYNAGSGNLSAGYGYADTILSNAGEGTNTVASSAMTTQASSSLSFWPDSLVKFFKVITDGVIWIRIAMVIGGGLILLFAFGQITGANRKVVSVVKSEITKGMR